jgi:hypothetical protein
MNVRKSAVGRVGVAALVLAAVSACGGQAGAASTPPATSTTTPSPSPTTQAVLTLGDTGVGGLALGMTKAKALATGLVGAGVADQDTGDCAMFYGKRGVGYIYFVGGKVRIITVKKSIRLTSGLGIGDTFRQLHRLYPDAFAEAEPGGRLYLPAPGAKIPAEYRIGIDTGASFPDSKIIEIALQGKPNGCYE